MLARMSFDDGLDDDEPGYRAPLPPDDRLWRHPSEVATRASRHGVFEIFVQTKTRIALSGAITKFPARIIRIARIPSGPNPRRRAANLSLV